MQQNYPNAGGQWIFSAEAGGPMVLRIEGASGVSNAVEAPECGSF